GRNTTSEITVLNVGTRKACIKVVDESWRQRPVVLQARVIRFKNLVPNSLRNERLGKARKPTFDAGQLSKCIAEVERLPIGQSLGDFSHEVVGPRGGVGRGEVVAKYPALGCGRE